MIRELLNFYFLKVPFINHKFLENVLLAGLGV